MSLAPVMPLEDPFLDIVEHLSFQESPSLRVQVDPKRRQLTFISSDMVWAVPELLLHQDPRMREDLLGHGQYAFCLSLIERAKALALQRAKARAEQPRTVWDHLLEDDFLEETSRCTHHH